MRLSCCPRSKSDATSGKESYIAETTLAGNRLKHRPARHRQFRDRGHLAVPLGHRSDRQHLAAPTPRRHRSGRRVSATMPVPVPVTAARSLPKTPSIRARTPVSAVSLLPTIPTISSSQTSHGTHTTSTASISHADRMRFSLVKAVPPASSMPAAKSAEFTNSGNLDLRFGSWGSTRESLDYNFQIVPDQVAFRLDLLNDDEKYEQKPAYSKDQRISGALRIEPAFLNKNGNQHRLQGELRVRPGRFRQSSRASPDGPHHSVLQPRRYRRLSGGAEWLEFVGIRPPRQLRRQRCQRLCGCRPCRQFE